MTTGSVTVTAADRVAAPLDLLITDAALGPLRRFKPGGAGLRLAAALAARPGLVAGRSRQLLGELSRVAAGTSAVKSRLSAAVRFPDAVAARSAFSAAWVLASSRRSVAYESRVTRRAALRRPGLGQVLKLAAQVLLAGAQGGGYGICVVGGLTADRACGWMNGAVACGELEEVEAGEASRLQWQGLLVARPVNKLRRVTVALLAATGSR
jgi:hypothetical protein